MTAIVNIHEATTHLSKLVERAQLGERITIARDDFDDPLPELEDHADDPIEPSDAGR